VRGNDAPRSPRRKEGQGLDGCERGWAGFVARFFCADKSGQKAPGAMEMGVLGLFWWVRSGALWCAGVRTKSDINGQARSKADGGGAARQDSEKRY